MLALTNVFKKHLKEYASRILLSNLPKLSQQANVSTSAANLTSTLMTRDIKEISTQLQNFHTLLKEGEQIKLLEPDEKVLVCSVIVTAEYIIETTQQLEAKLKEKVDRGLADSIRFVFLSYLAREYSKIKKGSFNYLPKDIKLDRWLRKSLTIVNPKP